MRDLDWWEIGVRSLKIPFAQWRTLLASLVPAAIVLTLGLAVASFAEKAAIADVLDTASWSILPAQIAFEWSWMMALWHTTLRQSLTFPVRRNFWLFSAIFGGITLAQEGAIAVIQYAIDHSHLADRDQLIAYLVWAVIWLPAIWISLRLAIWPAAIVANQRWVSPVDIWRATRGLAWDILFIGLVIFVPAFVLGGALVMGATLLAVATHSPFRTDIMIGGVGLLGVYSFAALSAAYLLAYHDICVAPKGAAPQGAPMPSQA